MNNNADNPKQKPRKTHSRVLYVRFPEQPARELERLARQRDRTVAFLIREAVERYLRAQKRSVA